MKAVVLFLFTTRDIFPNEETTHNYGDSSWPWHSRELHEASLVTEIECSVKTSMSGKEKQLCEESSMAMIECGSKNVYIREGELHEESLVTGIKCCSKTSKSGKETELNEESLVTGIKCRAKTSKSGKETELCEESSMARIKCSAETSTSGKETCRHEVHSAVISSLVSSDDCSGPMSSRT
ncbi:uncharacterized protein isoform X2 [Danio rerio]|uniref:Uncharacterized protein isoform X2 n=1 Tax=Danio rerio TaxID=7955 RepID=A0AC58JCB9_DANRE|nr:uncharacterized protein si:dkey-261o4.8 [Danio rerio]XP_021331175.1 uncharacterized protein si:dkey-261o4.8 [Danio rerio]|eukprot:XP_021331174.1 uncharacterized protein si:dkey-261o4.8 [Danio rerio]